MVAACGKRINIEISISSDNYGGQYNNKSIKYAYLHVVTNGQIYSVTHK